MSMIERLTAPYAGGNKFDGITSGKVVDTNDPQQMGRIRVLCPTLGDDAFEENFENIPWSSYASPFGGAVISENLSRGPDNETKTPGTVAYGMWGIPKVGATALIMCIDGNPLYRIWVGCIYGQNFPHTMPHGRYFEEPSQVGTGDGKPEGPISSNEDIAIQPLYENLTKAFEGGSVEGRKSHEWRTRGADYTVAGVSNDWLPFSPDTITFVPDEADSNKQAYEESDGTIRKVLQGYGTDRRYNHDEELESTERLRLDSQVYSITTPGFHAMAMDDRVENTRVRFRTSTGHQIILDDTNERIYIATAGGGSWIEMDSNGNVDMHSDRRVSIHAAKDINLTTEESFRVTAKKGVHFTAGEDVRINSNGENGSDFHIYSKNNIRLRSNKSVFFQSDESVHTNAADSIYSQAGADIHTKSGGTLFLTSGSGMNLKAGGNMFGQSAGNLNLKAGGNLLNTASAIHFNGPPAAGANSASSASAAGEKQAFIVNRVPLHEPYARRMLDISITDTDTQPTTIDFYDESIYEIPYSDSNVGRVELGEIITRGQYWRR